MTDIARLLGLGHISSFPPWVDQLYWFWCFRAQFTLSGCDQNVLPITGKLLVRSLPQFDDSKTKRWLDNC